MFLTRWIIVKYSRLVHKKGLTSGYDGNLSCRVGNNVYITASGIPKERVVWHNIIRLNINDTTYKKGRKKPSSETPMHLQIYRDTDEARAIIHAHPTYLTLLSLMEWEIDIDMLAEMRYYIRGIAIAPFATPGTPDGAKAIKGLTPKNDAIILPKHGVIVWAGSMKEAYYKLEKLESFARILFLKNIANLHKH